ncbi:MAG: N-6 DNA methylase [Nitrosomonas sp.]|uniref:N-6 DNA methylase n=1 Tax=Nitrosomonas sp. TaxID=42353 RepID=UPI0027342C2E|nr:N-6 DNA methylase [Nitrosomonas sp.]MDP3281510.1 N-6 DNA methylase [Nitrosomonas sp.]
MFYTVTLPATLWFFDKAKRDDRILFIDARNIFTQIDRAHREFSEEHIRNIAIISHLHKGQREKFIRLIDHYFAAGMERLIENNEKIEPVCAQLLDVLDDAGGKQAVSELLQHWKELEKLQTHYAQYREERAIAAEIDKKNQAQHQLRNAFDPFFSALHEGLKRLDKTVRQHEKQQTEQAQQEGKRNSTDRRTKALKTALEELHQDVKNAEIYFQHIHWLQERFPNAQYEDVTGLCKLATPEEIKEQDYSLNPGRYVGVVIEEDGKTESEFIGEVFILNSELELLNSKAAQLEQVISENVRKLMDE